MKISGRGCFTKGVLFVLLMMTGTGVLYSASAASAASENSGRKRGHRECISCHLSGDPDAGGALFPEGVEPSQPCLGCHKIANSHHPVNFQPERILFRDDEDAPLPLFGDKITCLTCHQIHLETDSWKLVRGGPYQDRRGICFKCHFDDADARTNPHRMLDSNNQVIVTDGLPVCVSCHTAVPKQNGFGIRVKFRAEVAFICWRCHPPMPGKFFDQHFMVRPSEKMRDSMKRSEFENNVIFPVQNRGRMTCSTCHNPHQGGVILYEPAAAGEDTYKKLRMPPGLICSGCHEK